ncbi:ADP-glyceromanno-heptose 6-epimerase [Fulvivirga sedimenti]|uniref:ADP-L-glycero-D-manno-heptose-6-epimerase n=1 Tax=Fulvivirga sedimenti TaxID=2879465 RepID=A0A9X1HWX4_9BACT|nr:ADP-glyceromanno-heptose 6-epimerase [Fulvivirga sedimenti]MCA6077902.1 ADP-glyceromanno-heptose 6-epimerase [Fulvivirga sedimenti]
MIVVTGAAGFIGSRLIKRLNDDGFNYIIAVDKFGIPEKERNLDKLNILSFVERAEFMEWLDVNYEEVEFIFHIGAKTDTTLFDEELLRIMNTDYTKDIWTRCVKYQIPLVYASSAATYGLGEQGYEDDEAKIPMLKPLNPYGKSKQDFDVWALEQEEKPFFWAGLKFFNVYGPNEYHKGRMASVVWHAYNQIRKTGGMKLFRSHNPEYKDGEQQRDFIYVDDVVDVCIWLMHHRQQSGIYNLGTGKSRTFLDLTRAVFSAMNVPENISFIDTPEDIRDKYQYFTEADMKKLRSAGYDRPFTELEEGITRYVQTYLKALFN